MRRLLTLLLLASPVLSFAQGISFETGDWKSVLAKATAENRLVYVDVYATWCGPCKVLAATIFPQKEAGDVYNARFVNYRIDAEKGEGPALEKKYKVNSYPTHLFIDPKTEAVVYRARGASKTVADFNENAAVALSEQKDPMTWAVYTGDFKAGKRDQQFLRDYLRKAERLDQPNEAILNAYIATLDTKNIPDSTLYWIDKQTKTIWNNAVAVLYTHRERLAARDSGRHWYRFEDRAERWLYPSYNQLKDAKDEKRLARLETFIRTYLPEEANEKIFFYRKRYYDETGNPAKLKQAELEEARWITSRKLADYKSSDEAARKNQEASIRYQLTVMTLPEGKSIDTIVAENLRNQVGALPSIRAAGTLNSLAWKTYENKKANTTELQQALKWSAKAMEFSAPYAEQWAPHADTHALLLYRTGKRPEAIILEEKAMQALQDAGNEKEATEYGETLQKMKAGMY